jgi:glucokinase
MTKDRVLAGDIGGTNARLRLYDVSGQVIEDETTLPSGHYPSLQALIAPYLQGLGVRVRAAVFGIAGPVVDGVSRVTNLPWVVDEKELARELGIDAVRIVNDLAAVAMGCTHVSPDKRVVLVPGAPPKAANMAVISAGTGLGEALLIWDGERHIPCSTEGGHADFAPRTPIEIELLQYLLKAHHRISYERIVSGPGIGNLYDFFVRRSGATEPEPVLRELENGDRNAAITRLGLSGQSKPAANALDLFAEVYGAEAGNLVLKGLGIGGLFLCGRIGADIIPARKDIFLAAMRDKGRVSPLIERVPVTIVLDSRVGLVGAGHLAARLAAA